MNPSTIAAPSSAFAAAPFRPLAPATRRAMLFDLYPLGREMVLWFITDEGERLRLVDPFAPVFYLAGFAAEPGRRREDLRRALAGLPGFAWTGATERLDFWTGRPREVERIRVTDLDAYGANLRALFRRLPGLTYFNCDIAPEVHYAYDRGVFPTARCDIATEGDRLTACYLADDARATRYAPPDLRVAELRAEGVSAGRRPRLAALTLAAEGRAITWDEGDPEAMLHSLRDALADADPDLIWTVGGDSVLMPALLAMAARFKIDLGLDREPGVARRLQYEGRSYISYGRVLYQAPDYPLYGRWHLDRHNSFWADETGLAGLIEVARMSKLPVQRAARRSIGTGISSIQLDYAYREGYLIPWKKARPEAWKTANALIRADRGGLVYQPLTGVYEDVIELDFVSMYPSIMARLNVSPETVNCACCADDPAAPRVPGIGYAICRRRRGLVSRALEPIIAKRREYKRRMKALADGGSREGGGKGEEDSQALYRRLDGRQSALKWLLVCCFGYLGYRNARFGRIEAHEATCAYSREMLLQARELSEARGFDVLHAIVDCVWIRKPGATGAEIDALIGEIDRATGLSIALEGRYRWIAFLPSRRDPDVPVPNRYFGLMRGGKLKYRGIEIRRSDQAPCARQVQGELLERLRGAETLAAARAMREELLEIARRAEDRLRLHEAPIEDVILRRKTSREAGQYRSNNMTAVAARQAARAGYPLHAGEAVRFVVIDAKNRDADSRLRLVALLAPEESYDAAFYIEQVRRAAATVLEPMLGETRAALFGEPAPAKRGTRRAKKVEHERARTAQLDFLVG